MVLSRPMLAAVLGVVGVLTAGCSLIAPTPPVLPTAQYDPVTGWSDRPVTPPSAPAERWRTPLGVSSRWAVDAAGTALVVARGDDVSTTTVQRLDPATGAVVWRATVPGIRPESVTLATGGSPTAVVLTITPGGRSATLLGLADGRVQRTVDAGSVSAVTDDVLVLSDLGREGITTAAIDRRTGATRWTAVSVATTSVMTRSGLVVLVQSATGRQALDAATGAPRWRRPPATFSDATPVGDTVLVTDQKGSGSLDDQLRSAAGLDPGGPTFDSTVTSLDALTGRTRWSSRSLFTSVGRSPTAAPLADGSLLVATPSPSPNTAAVDARTGQVLWRAPEVAATVSLRVGGTGYAVALPAASADAPLTELTDLTVLDARSGAVVDSLTDLDYETADFSGGALYREDAGSDASSYDDEQVVAHVLPGLDELWSVPTGPVNRIRSIPRGFVAATGPDDDSPVDLVGYLG